MVTKRAPTATELEDMKFAFKIAKHVKSNAVIYAKDGQTAGIGAGQMSRVDSARIAALKAEDAAKALGLAEPLTKGSAVASEAFYPFADGLLAAIAAGATAVIQPVDRCGMPKSSPLPTNTMWRWSSPAFAISATDRGSFR